MSDTKQRNSGEKNLIITSFFKSIIPCGRVQEAKIFMVTIENKN